MRQTVPLRRNRELEEKATKLLNTWLIYLDLASLTSAKLSAGDETDPLVWEQGVSLADDALVLEESLFKQLKVKAVEARAKNDSFKLAVTFPKIYKVEDGVRQFQPLFTIDVSSIFQGNFRTKGWDLTQGFEFQPVIPNLIDVAGLDEEKTENLVIGERLKHFLEDTFDTRATTLQSFLNLLVLPDIPQTVQFIPFLARFDFIPYTYNLKKDIQKILEKREDWDWAYPGHPAFNYLFGHFETVEDKDWYTGAFPTHPPTDSQVAVFKHLRHNCLTPVVGPPGCGKTVSLAHGVAMVVCDRALHLMESGQDESNLTLITSTNNRAVQNAEMLLAEDAALAPLFLPGGSKKKIKEQSLPLLWEAINWLDSTPIDKSEREKTVDALQQRVTRLRDALAQDPINQQKRQQIDRSLAVVDQKIHSLELELEMHRGSDHASDSLGDYSQFPLNDYQKLQECLSKYQDLNSSLAARPALPASRSQWLYEPLKWLRYWFVQLRWRVRRAKFYNQLVRLTSQIQGTAFPIQFQLPLSKQILGEKHTYITAQIKAAQIWQRVDRIQTKLNQQIDRRTHLRQQLEKYPPCDFYSRFHTTEFHGLQQEIFQLSRQYLKQEALRRKTEVKHSLELYAQILQGIDQDGTLYRRFGRQWHTVYRDLSLLFPVVTSTLHSIRNMFPFPDRNSIAYVFADEAGTTGVHQLFPALVRCRKALVVGDPMQLQPIVSFSRQLIDRYYQLAFIDQGLTEDDYEWYSPTAYDMTSAYQRSAGVKGQANGKGSGIVLTDHFRCPPPLAALVDRLGGYGLLVKSNPVDPALGSHLIATHVEGSQQKDVNLQEVEAVISWVEHLYSLGYSFGNLDKKKTIAVISPYRKQATALYQALHQRWRDCDAENVNTIHTFQGGERAIVILSTRQCKPTDGLQFLNRGPNLINVAVSRATESLILVGNLERLEHGRYSQILVEHIKQYGDRRLIPSTR